MEYHAPTKLDDVAIKIDNLSPALATDHNGLVMGRWKASLFSCFDSIVPNAIMSWCCPVVSVAQISARVGMEPFYHVLGAFVGLHLLAILAAATDVKFLGGVTWFAAFFAFFWMVRMRRHLRATFAIPGSRWGDVATSLFCGCCSIAQMATHVESYEAGKFAFAPRATLPGYSFK